MFTPSHADLAAVAPEIILGLSAGFVLLVEAFLPRVRRYLSELTMIAVGGSIWARLTFELPGEVWAGALRIDRLASFVDI